MYIDFLLTVEGVLGSILEHAVVLSIMTEDQEAFERHFLQLKPFYCDARSVIGVELLVISLIYVIKLSL